MIHQGDCLDVMATMAPESVDSIVTDPPYGLSFMGKDWDHGVPGVHFWTEALRVAKPGTHLLAFGGTRTFHRLTCAIEDAGWEIRDCIMWVYGSGFPKSHNLKDDWQGWGTALKPAWEPIIVARKPLAGTVAENVQRFGTGAVNVDGCRVGISGATKRSHQQPYGANGRMDQGGSQPWRTGHSIEELQLGRWPANLIHDGSGEVTGLFPVTTSGGGNKKSKNPGMWSGKKPKDWHDTGGDTGSAARFFYCAKASKADRDEGCEGLEQEKPNGNKWSDQDYRTEWSDGVKRSGGNRTRRNHHPTVKPTDLMRYLCRLVTPPGGTVLDPFCGSGSTGKAARLEGFDFIGIELNPDYIAIANTRINAVANKMPLLEPAK